VSVFEPPIVASDLIILTFLSIELRFVDSVTMVLLDNYYYFTFFKKKHQRAEQS